MPVALFYAVALLLPGVVAGATAIVIRRAWRARGTVSGAAKWCLAGWILVSLLAIGYGGLGALAVSIARATTPGRADHGKALAGVLVLVALEAAAGLVLRIVLRRPASV